MSHSETLTASFSLRFPAIHLYLTFAGSFEAFEIISDHFKPLQSHLKRFKPFQTRLDHFQASISNRFSSSTLIQCKFYTVESSLPVNHWTSFGEKLHFSNQNWSSNFPF